MPSGPVEVGVEAPEHGLERIRLGAVDRVADIRALDRDDEDLVADLGCDRNGSSLLCETEAGDAPPMVGTYP